MRAILHLGGNPTRITSTIAVAHLWTDAIIIIGSSEDPVNHYRALQSAGIDMKRVIFDFRAWDTVSNFTQIRDILKEHKITALCIVTDKFHTARASLIAYIVYHTAGVDIYMKSHYDPYMQLQRDSYVRVFKDICRAWIARFTSRTVWNESRTQRLSRIKQCADQFQHFLDSIDETNRVHSIR